MRARSERAGGAIGRIVSPTVKTWSPDTHEVVVVRREPIEVRPAGLAVRIRMRALATAGVGYLALHALVGGVAGPVVLGFTALIAVVGAATYFATIFERAGRSPQAVADDANVVDPAKARRSSLRAWLIMGFAPLAAILINSERYGSAVAWDDNAFTVGVLALTFAACDAVLLRRIDRQERVHGPLLEGDGGQLLLPPAPDAD